MSGNLSKSAFFEGGARSLRAEMSDGTGRHPPTTVGVTNYSDCPFVLYKNIRSVLSGFVTKHACDRQTELGQPIPR